MAMGLYRDTPEGTKAAEVAVRIPPALQKFILRFDAGEYPALLQSAPAFPLW